MNSGNGHDTALDGPFPRLASLPLGRLVPHEKNPRKVTPEALARLEKSLAELGNLQPVVFNIRSGKLLRGHQRVKCLQAMGRAETEVWCVDLPEEREAAALIALNKGAGEWDDAALVALFNGLDSGGIDLELTGFDAKEIENLIRRLEPPKQTDAAPQLDKAEELNRKWGVAPGDVWRVGAHRFMCGNSMSAADVQKLMAGESVGLCFTSPPYAQQRDYTEESHLQEWEKMMIEAIRNIPPAEDCQILVNLGLVHKDGAWDDYWQAWINWMRFNGWRSFGWYVWDQGFGLPGDWAGRFAPSHEFIFHFNKTAVRPNKIAEKKEESIVELKRGGNSMRNKDGTLKSFSNLQSSAATHKIPDSVIRINRMHGGHGVEHPAIFSVALPMLIVEAWEGLVYDPFLGSGTTMLACENLGRPFRGMEISPAYCAVILERMADAFPGIEIEKIQ